MKTMPPLRRVKTSPTRHVAQLFDLGLALRCVPSQYNRPVTVIELLESDAASAVSLWAESGLTRPWNDPIADYRRALEGAGA